MGRRLITTGVASLALVLGSCGDDGDDRARTVDPPEPEAPVDAPENTEDSENERSDFELNEALLALDDMPTGWTLDSEETSGDDGDSPPLCDAELLDDVEPIDEASIAFSAGDLGPFLSHTVVQFEDDQAEEALDAFIGALDDCEEWTEESDEGLMTFRPAPLSFPSFGEETIAVRIDVDHEMVDMTMDMIVWRQVDTLSVIGVVEAFGTPDGEQTEEFATVADERLVALL